MIKDGIGGGNTTTGLVFETKADLKTLLNGISNYRVDEENNVFFKDKLVGMIFVKHDLYRFLEKNGVKWQDYLSKKLLPDDSIYVILKIYSFIYDNKKTIKIKYKIITVVFILLITYKIDLFQKYLTKLII